MGIDAQAFSSDLPMHWFPGKSLSANRKTLENAARSWATSQNLGPLFQLKLVSETAFEIEIVPIADPIHIDFEGKRLVARFRSSNGGPGYHAAAIELLEALGQALSVTWKWVASNGAALDETGYATTRDFPALQYEISAFLGQICKSTAVTEAGANNMVRGLALCVPSGLGHVPGKVACPLGFSPLRWVLEVMEKDGDELLEEAASFFVWWEKGLTPTTWVQLLRAQLWQNAEWRPARSEADLLVRDQIRHSYAQATALGEKLPEDLDQEYLCYLECQSQSEAPAEDGIGYRKYLVWAQVYPSWAMSLPGYLSATDQDGSLCFEHPSLWLGLSALSIEANAEAETGFSWPDRFGGHLFEIRPGITCRKSLREESDGMTVQSAMIWSMRPNRHRLLIVTLSSRLDWPFEAFDRWIMTVSCPDLPEDSLALPSTLH
jgi:hypothetical protein